MRDAYDYERQCWVTGPAARQLRASYARDTLAILESDRGAEYLVWTGNSRGLEEAILEQRAILDEARARED